MPFEAECSESILPYKKCIKGSHRARLWGTPRPITLCMHELALTRSEPEAKMNTTHPKPDAVQVQSLHSGSGAEPLKGTLSGESCILKISEQTHYLSPRMETPFSILMWTGIVVISWYCHIHGLCFYPECLSCPAWPHVRPRYRGGLLSTCKDRKAGSAGGQRPLGTLSALE